MEQGDATVAEPDDTTQPVFVPDTGDLIDKTLPDPPPAEVTDPDDPSYVEPDPSAVRVNPDLLLPVGTSLPSAPDDDPERDPEGHA